MSKLSSPLIIEDFGELLALHRVIVEARFSKDPNDIDVQRSTLISDLANKVAKLLDENDEMADWAQHLIADEHPKIVEIMVNRIKTDDSEIWTEMDLERKPEFIRFLVAPFKPSDLLIEKIIAENT